MRVTEERVVFREIIDADGRQRIEIDLEGDHETKDPELPSSLIFMIAGAIYLSFEDGSLQRDLQERYGLDLSHLIPRRIENGN